MERKKDITLDNLCSIHFPFCCFAKDVIFGKEDGISNEMRETCWKIMRAFSDLVTSSEISYKISLMCSMWDTLYPFVNDYIRCDKNLPRRRTAVEIYEIMKPIEDARTIKTEK